MNYEAIIAQKDDEIRQLSEKISELTHHIAMLEKHIFGRKTEKFIPTPDPNQLSLFDVQEYQKEEKAEVDKQTVTYEREKKKSRHNGRQLLANCTHLPVDERIIDTEHDANDIHIGYETTERLAKKPGQLFIIRYKRCKYKKADEDKIITSPAIEEPIAKCEADVSLLADVIVSKFVDHIPEYRQQQIYKREGVTIPASTMNGWIHQLGPYMKLMSEYIKAQILTTNYIQKDESTIKVMDGKKNKTHTGYMWVMSAKALDYVYFEYQKGRDRTGPLTTLKEYRGFLQSDAYDVYEIIDKTYEHITHFLCWAHARRKFFEALTNDQKRSEYALAEIQKLYDIERHCREKEYTTQQRQVAREEAKDILVRFKEWLDQESFKVTPRSPIGKAMAYIITRWEKFTKYTDYGEVEIDNNIIENAIRPLALGRKNYLFAGNHQAATNIGYFYTVMGTCKALNVNQYDYLVWFLSRVASVKTSDIATLAPDIYQRLMTPDM